MPPPAEPGPATNAARLIVGGAFIIVLLWSFLAFIQFDWGLFFTRILIAGAVGLVGTGIVFIVASIEDR